jgi:hypothetical protein
MQYDLMLFKIDKPAPAGLAPIELNRDAAVPADNQVLTAVGFGSTSQGGPDSTDLLTVDLEAMPDKECDPMLRAFDMHDESMMCAYAPGKDTCQVRPEPKSPLSA